MRLLTHNYLKSTVRGTEKGYPLIIEATKIEYDESKVDDEFVLTLLAKIDYDVLRDAVSQVANLCDPPMPSIPDQSPIEKSAAVDTDDRMIAKTAELKTSQGQDDCEDINVSNEEGGDECTSRQFQQEDNVIDNEIIQKLRQVLFDYHIVEGHLICPDTGRRFPITGGIPNMILHEDEI